MTDSLGISPDHVVVAPMLPISHVECTKELHREGDSCSTADKWVWEQNFKRSQGDGDELNSIPTGMVMKCMLPGEC